MLCLMNTVPSSRDWALEDRGLSGPKDGSNPLGSDQPTVFFKRSRHIIIEDGEQAMKKTLTVAELIQILQRFDQDLPVEMGMNEEYQEEVTEDMIVIEEYDGRRYLMITDCPPRGPCVKI